MNRGILVGSLALFLVGCAGCNIFKPTPTPPTPPPTTPPITTPEPEPEQPENPQPEPEPVPREDFYLTLNLKEYSVGDKFDFDGMLQNATEENLFIDNSNKDGLEYRLMKEGATLFKQQLPSFKMDFLEYGWIKWKFENNEVKSSFCNVTAEFNGNNYTVPYPIVLSLPTQPAGTHTFKEKGKYIAEAEVNYKVGDEGYKSVWTKEIEVK